MIPNTVFDTFQPIIDFSYGLDVEIRPKLAPGAGTQVQYSTALWLHGHDLGELAKVLSACSATPHRIIQTKKQPEF